MITFKLTRDQHNDYNARGLSDVGFCSEGLAAFFHCTPDELEDNIWLNIDTVPFDGFEYKIEMRSMDIEIDGKEWYVMLDTRHALKRIINSDPEDQMFYVSFEVKA